jgi:hypothetical protein
MCNLCSYTIPSVPMISKGRKSVRSRSLAGLRRAPKTTLSRPDAPARPDCPLCADLGEPVQERATTRQPGPVRPITRGRSGCTMIPWFWIALLGVLAVTSVLLAIYLFHAFTRRQRR